MLSKKLIYLDNNATTPVDPTVLNEMLPYFFEKFGNAASRTHSLGWEAEEAVDIAREEVASLINASPQEIIFTSGATEAVNLAMKGLFEKKNPKGDHIITTDTEHKAVLDTCRSLEQLGAHITYLPVSTNGLIDCEQLEEAMTDRTILISIMYANNETGVIQPISQIGRIAKKNGVPFFCDGTQAVGKIPVNVRMDQIDLMALSAHKFYGPKGIGALYVNKKNADLDINAQIHGGGHERSLRSGTLNVPGIVGLGKASSLSSCKIDPEGERLRNLRGLFEDSLAELGGITLNGINAPRLPHCTNISIEGIDGDRLMMELSNEIAFSRSSACTSATLEPSHVLKAMGLSEETIYRSFRFSMGWFTSTEQIEHTIKLISMTIKKHRNERNY
jgi:cysteine desulfurase